MYEFGFGDCFRIEHLVGSRKKGLWVDCGIHNLSWSRIDRSARYKIVESDISDSDSFLLSHYHADHYSGAISIHKRFKDIYIPDVWNFDGCIKVIKLLLWESFSKKTYITSGLTLFDFLKRLCYSTVHFVKRGDIIDNDFIALWPKQGELVESATDFFERENLPLEIDERLEQIAIKTDEIVLAINRVNNIRVKEEQDIERKRLIGRLNYYERQWSKLYEENNEMISSLIEDKNESLASFGNRISIVFQDINGDESLLFTGDFCEHGDVGLWNYLEMNIDCVVDMKELYKLIKIPHHGTKAYYHDFKSRINDDTILLMPNGLVNADWPICHDYIRDVNDTNCRVICSLNSACEGCIRRGRECDCNKNNVIYPRVFEDITIR